MYSAQDASSLNLFSRQITLPHFLFTQTFPLLDPATVEIILTENSVETCWCLQVLAEQFDHNYWCLNIFVERFELNDFRRSEWVFFSNNLTTLADVWGYLLNNLITPVNIWICLLNNLTTLADVRVYAFNKLSIPVDVRVCLLNRLRPIVVMSGSAEVSVGGRLLFYHWLSQAKHLFVSE